MRLGGQEFPAPPLESPTDRPLGRPGEAAFDFGGPDASIFSCTVGIISLSSALKAHSKRECPPVRESLEMSRVSQPIGERFSREQVLRILGLSERQLSAWERQGLVPLPPVTAPELKPGKLDVPGRNCLASTANQDRPYTFSDIVTFRTLLELRRQGVPPARLRSVHAALSQGWRTWNGRGPNCKFRRTASAFPSTSKASGWNL